MTFYNSSVVKKDIASIVSNPLPWRQFKNQKILITGATGMIPAYAVLTLLAANKKYDLGLTVVCLARSSAKIKQVFGKLVEQNNFITITQDVTQPIDINCNIDYVIHGASPARPQLHSSSPVSTIKANVLGTMNLLDLCVIKKAKAFVLMSSAEVYGSVNKDIDSIKENDYGVLDILSSRACYSEGKRAAETLCAVYEHQYGINFLAARFGHIFGPGLALDDGRVQADFARNVVQHENILLKSAGLAKRSYTYITDAVSGMFYALLLGESGAYNISNNLGTVSIRELAERFVQSRPERNLQLIFDKAEDQSAYSKATFQALDSTKLEQLGWKSKVNITNGIDRFISHLELSCP